MRRRCHHQFL